MLSLPGTRIVYSATDHTTTPGMRFVSIPRPGGKWKSLMLVGIFSTDAASVISLTNSSDMRFETGAAPEGYGRESRMRGGYGA